jgi:uncharacterized protein
MNFIPVTLDDIEALAVGAWILGTGGGGSPYLGLLNMRRLYAEGHRVRLISPFDLDDEDWVAVVSNMGRRWSGKSGWSTAATLRMRSRSRKRFSGRSSLP